MPNTTYGSPYAQSSDLVSNWPGVSLNIADRIDDVSFKGNGLNDQTGTTYTLVLTDAGKTVTLNNASAVTVTVPTNASVAYETGTVIEFTNKGAGVVTISPAGGVTLNNAVTLAQYSSAYIQKLDTNTWVMVSAPQAGLTLVASSTFSAVSSVSVNNCFTSTYANYLLKITGSASGANVNLQMRLRASGSDDSNASYNVQALDADGATVSGGRAASQTLWTVGLSWASAVASNTQELSIFRPNEVERTTFLTMYTTPLNTGFVALRGGYFNNTTAFDGFTLLINTGTITGTVRVYGYRNS